MLLILNDLLTSSEVDMLVELSNHTDFVDGGVSAEALARRGIKQNTEMLRTGPNSRIVRDTIISALQRNLRFCTATLPQKINDPIISRYVAGQHYGTHIDQPVIYGKDREPFRVDISITIFLSSPEGYQGGELVVDTGYGENAIKLPAGRGVAYPTTMPHRVAELTSGTRLAAVTWIQSLVPDQARRKIIYDLAMVTHFLQNEHPKSEHFHRLYNAYANLIRQWATG